MVHLPVFWKSVITWLLFCHEQTSFFCKCSSFPPPGWAKMRRPWQMVYTVGPHFSGIDLFWGIKQCFWRGTAQDTDSAEVLHRIADFSRLFALKDLENLSDCKRQETTYTVQAKFFFTPLMTLYRDDWLPFFQYYPNTLCFPLIGTPF